MLSRILTAAVVAGAMALTTPSYAQTKHVVIGTGGQTGVYYQVGGAICRLVNRDSKRHNINCTHTTGASVQNINGIRVGNLDMGVTQSDWESHAYFGTAPNIFPEGAFKELGAVFSVHPELFTVVARKDAKIKTFDDLKGKRVNIGNPGSGNRATMDILMEKMGWTRSDFSLASELAAAEQSAALCDGRVDAIIYFVGHPNGAIKEATTSCDSHVVSVDNAVVRQLVADHDYYAQAVVPGGMYRGSDEDVTTFGVVAAFVASTATDDEVIYQIVSSVFSNIDRFRRMHPAFEFLKEEDMISRGLSSPLHEGAVRYYKERGWM